MNNQRKEELKKLVSPFAPALLEEQWEQLLPLLDRATTTSFWAKKHGGRCNEAQEFFGDAIYRLAILEGIVNLHPRESRVQLFECVVAVLGQGTIQEQLAHEIGLDALLLIPEGYQPKEGHEKFESLSVLDGNALEAIIGAFGELSVKLAMRVAKKLMSARLKGLLHQFYKHPQAKKRTGFDTRYQLIGHARLRVYLTQELLRQGNNTRIYGLHRARDAMMMPRQLAKYARVMSLTTTTDTDEEAMKRLLEACGKDLKLSRDLKNAVVRWVNDALTTLHNEQGYLMCRNGTPTRPAPRQHGDAEAQLLTFLGTRATCRFESKPHGGGEQRQVHIRCFVNDELLGEGLHKDPKVAREQAAHATLSHPVLLTGGLSKAS